MKAIQHILLGVLLVAVFAGCQHARLSLVKAPPECKPEFLPKCVEEKVSGESVNAAKEKIFAQPYFLWGLKPEKITMNSAELCPEGVREIYQFSTWKDELLSNLTGGIYMPRTLRIVCY